MQPASLGWLFPVHCNIEFMWDEPERLNWWQIFKEQEAKVPPLENITLTHWFERSFLTLHRLSTIQDDSICQCSRFCDRWLSSLVFLVWRTFTKALLQCTMDFPLCLCSPQLWSQTAHSAQQQSWGSPAAKGMNEDRASCLYYIKLKKSKYRLSVSLCCTGPSEQEVKYPCSYYAGNYGHLCY